MKRVGINEFIKRIGEILRLSQEEGEAIEVTDSGKVVARLVPVSEPQPSIEPKLTPFWEKMERLAIKIDSYLPEQTVEDSDAAAWAKLKRIASELGPYWPENVDAVAIVREGRREL